MIYEPREDSFLLEREVKKYSKGKKVLDVGAGSGIQGDCALRNGALSVLFLDVDEEVVEYLEMKGYDVVESDLFNKIKGKFELIIFNPPYLPEDEREDGESSKSTSGGEKGDEIIVRFLDEVGEHLEEDGKVLLVVSSLTPLSEIEKVMGANGMEKKVLGSERVFMEGLEVWEIRKS